MISFQDIKLPDEMEIEALIFSGYSWILLKKAGDIDRKVRKPKQNFNNLA